MNQKGASVLAVVAAMLILGVMGVTLISLVSTGSDVSINQLQSEKAFNIAAGGIEYTLGKNKSNIPNYSTNGTWVNLGDGDFKVDTLTYLTEPTNPILANATTIHVYSAASFPSSGSITINDVFMRYTAKDDAANRLPLTNPATAAHSVNNSVYPAARLAAKIPSDPSCATVATITLSENTGGFDISHSFFIDNEYFYCSGKSLVPPYTFTGCTRCYAGSPFGLHSSTYAAQYILTSTGRITNIISNNAQRVVRVSAGPKEE